MWTRAGCCAVALALAACEDGAAGPAADAAVSAADARRDDAGVTSRPVRDAAASPPDGGDADAATTDALPYAPRPIDAGPPPPPPTPDELGLPRSDAGRPIVARSPLLTLELEPAPHRPVAGLARCSRSPASRARCSASDRTTSTRTGRRSRPTSIPRSPGRARPSTAPATSTTRGTAPGRSRGRSTAPTPRTCARGSRPATSTR
jgi:hypothetical protein